MRDHRNTSSVQPTAVEGNTQHGETSKLRQAVDDASRELKILADILERFAELEPRRGEMGADDYQFFDEVEGRLSQLAGRYVGEKNPADLDPEGRAALERLKALVNREVL